MASPGQRRGTCGHAMALFDTHTKCARCRDKGLGQDACVEKKDFVICNNFTAEQKLQLATPTYRARKDKELQKKTASPSLVDPSRRLLSLLLGRLKVARVILVIEVKSLPRRRRPLTSHLRKLPSLQRTQIFKLT